jgi:hypothetical protein
MELKNEKYSDYKIGQVRSDAEEFHYFIYLRVSCLAAHSVLESFPKFNEN